MALVLKTREGNLRRFESCPFRQFKEVFEDIKVATDFDNVGGVATSNSLDFGESRELRGDINTS